MQQSRDALVLLGRPVSIPQPSSGPKLGHPWPHAPHTLSVEAGSDQSQQIRGHLVRETALPSPMTEVENGHQSIVPALVEMGKQRKGTGQGTRLVCGRTRAGPGVLTPNAVLSRLKHNAVTVLERWVTGMVFTN